MRIHDPIALAKTLSPFDFRELEPFNDAAFRMYYGDRLDASTWADDPRVPGAATQVVTPSIDDRSV